MSVNKTNKTTEIYFMLQCIALGLHFFTVALVTSGKVLEQHDFHKKNMFLDQCHVLFLEYSCCQTIIALFWYQYNERTAISGYACCSRNRMIQEHICPIWVNDVQLKAYRWKESGLVLNNASQQWFSYSLSAGPSFFIVHQLETQHTQQNDLGQLWSQIY